MIERTDGIPLFVEEMTRAVWKRTAKSGGAHSAAATVSARAAAQATNIGSHRFTNRNVVLSKPGADDLRGCTLE